MQQLWMWMKLGASEMWVKEAVNQIATDQSYILLVFINPVNLTALHPPSFIHMLWNKTPVKAKEFQGLKVSVTF